MAVIVLSEQALFKFIQVNKFRDCFSTAEFIYTHFLCILTFAFCIFVLMSALY